MGAQQGELVLHQRVARNISGGRHDLSPRPPAAVRRRRAYEPSNRASNGCGNKSLSRYNAVSSLTSPTITSKLPPNSHKICRQAPQGGVGSFVSVTIAMRVNSR